MGIGGLDWFGCGFELPILVGGKWETTPLTGGGGGSGHSLGQDFRVGISRCIMYFLYGTGSKELKGTPVPNLNQASGGFRAGWTSLEPGSNITFLTCEVHAL